MDRPRIVALRLDIDSSGSIEAAASQASDTTILINNAGISDSGQPALTVSLDDVRRVFRPTCSLRLAVTQAFAPVLAGNGGGAVVNIHSALSLAGHWSVRGNEGRAVVSEQRAAGGACWGRAPIWSEPTSATPTRP